MHLDNRMIVFEFLTHSLNGVKSVKVTLIIQYILDQIEHKWRMNTMPFSIRSGKVIAYILCR